MVAGEFQRSRRTRHHGSETLSQFLTGDANISNSSSSHHPSAGSDAAPDGNSGKRAKITDPAKPGKDKAKVKDLHVCKGFNNGQCQGEAGKVCPKCDRHCHKCVQCGSLKHSVLECPQKGTKEIQAAQGAPWKKQNGKGGGKKGGRDGW